MKRGTTTINLKPFMKVEVRIKIEVSIGILISLKVCYKSRKKHQKKKIQGSDYGEKKHHLSAHHKTLKKIVGNPRQHFLSRTTTLRRTEDPQA